MRGIWIKYQLENSNKIKSGPNKGETQPHIGINSLFRADFVRSKSSLVQGSSHFFCD